MPVTTLDQPGPIASAISTDQVFRAAPLVRYPAGSGEIVYFPLQESALLIPSVLAESLAAHMRSRADIRHAGDLAGSVPLSTEDAEGLLRQLAGAGAIVARDEVLRGKPDPAPPGVIATVAIPTCNRPGQLARCVASFAANASRFGRTPALLITDDSSGDHRAAAREVAHASQASYAGHAEKARFAKAVAAAAEIDPAIVEFALFGTAGGVSMGANRNAILLQATGSLVYSIDDDTVCRTGRAASQAENERLTMAPDSADPADFHFFESVDAIDPFVEWSEIDVLGEHARVLGRSLPDLVASWDPAALDASRTCEHAWSRLCRGEGRISMSYNGYFGDSAMHSGWALLALPSDATWQRLMASEAAYRTAVGSRQVARQSPSVSIAHCEPCVGMCMGLDNREILPPFFPVGRNEDGIFGRLMERCIAGSQAAHLPWGIVHAPPDVRQYQSDAAASSRISDLILDCIATWPGSPAARTTTGALRSLGRHFVELGELEPGDLFEILRHSRWQTASTAIQRNEALLKRRAGAPEYWAARIRKQNDLLLKGMMDPAFLVPTDLNCGPDDALETIQTLILKYGQLLADWPAMIEATRKLREQGVELASTV